MWGTEHTAQLPTVVGRYLLTYQPTGTKKLYYLHILDKSMEDMHLECKSSIFDSYSILIVRDNIKDLRQYRSKDELILEITLSLS